MFDINITDWKITPRFLIESCGVIILAFILILQFGLLKCFGLKTRYFILFGLTSNKLEAIQENTFLMHDSITKKTEVRAGEKDKYISVSST